MGYRKLHEKLKTEENFKEISLKKVQGALQKLRSSETSKGPVLYSASDDGTLREWSFGGELLRSFTGAEGVQCVQVTDDHIIGGDSSGLMRIWSRPSGEVVKDIKVASRYVKTVLVSGEYIFTGDYCNLVQQWLLTTGELQAQYKGHKAGVISMAIAGDLLLAGGGDGHVLLFDGSKATKGEDGVLVVEAVESVYKAAGFVCSLEICEDRLLVPDRDEHKVASLRLFSHTNELVPENIRDVRSYKCSMPVWQAAAAGKDIVLALCRDFTVKKFAAGSRQLLMTIKVTPTHKEAKNPYALKVDGDRCYVGYLNSGEIAAFSLQDGTRQESKGFLGHRGSVNAFCTKEVS